MVPGDRDAALRLSGGRLRHTAPHSRAAGTSAAWAALNSCVLACTCSLRAASVSLLSVDLQELHEVYWEPLAQPQNSLQAILEGPPVKKLLFMTDASRIASAVLPHWEVRMACSWLDGRALALCAWLAARAESACRRQLEA